MDSELPTRSDAIVRQGDSPQQRVDALMEELARLTRNFEDERGRAPDLSFLERLIPTSSD